MFMLQIKSEVPGSCQQGVFKNHSQHRYGKVQYFCHTGFIVKFNQCRDESKSSTKSSSCFFNS